MVAVMPRGQTLVKSTPPPLGLGGGLKTQVRTIVGVPRPRVALAGILLLLTVAGRRAHTEFVRVTVSPGDINRSMQGLQDRG